MTSARMTFSNVWMTSNAHKSASNDTRAKTKADSESLNSSDSGGVNHVIVALLVRGCGRP